MHSPFGLRSPTEFEAFFQKKIELAYCGCYRAECAKSLLTKGRELNKGFFGLCSKDCKNIHIKDDKLLCNYVARRPLVQK